MLISLCSFRTHKDISSLQSRCLAVPGWYVPGGMSPVPSLAIAPSRSSFSGSSYLYSGLSVSPNYLQSKTAEQTAKKNCNFFQLINQLVNYPCNMLFFQAKWRAKFTETLYLKGRWGYKHFISVTLLVDKEIKMR